VISMIPTGLSLVMATRNEAEAVGKIVSKLAKVLLLLPIRTELIIADYSEDNTIDLAVSAASKYGLRIVPLKIGQPGRGLAIRTGVRHTNFNLICLIDGDGNHDPRYIPKFLEAYKLGSIVSATRFPPLGWSEEHTFLHYFGNRIATFSFNLLFQGNISDITNGFYLMSRKIWDSLELSSNKWSLDAQIICKALKKGIEIVEISYFEPKRRGGQASLNLLTAFWRIGGRVLLESVTT
jgi:glycosyltransferase involved in cell wall biosynthesis